MLNPKREIAKGFLINSGMVNIFNPLVDLQDKQLTISVLVSNAASLIADRATSGKLMRDGKLLGQLSAGRMSMFIYDPKTKQNYRFMIRFH